MKNFILQPGDKVHYSPKRGGKKNGLVKSIPEGENFAFVVFNCAGEWKNFMNYTGENTKLEDLKPGWFNETQTLCDHEFEPTNHKWKPIGQMQCTWCGEVK